MRPKAHLALGHVFLGRVLFRGLKRATTGPMGLRPHFFNRGSRPGPIAVRGISASPMPKYLLLGHKFWPNLHPCLTN